MISFFLLLLIYRSSVSLMKDDLRIVRRSKIALNSSPNELNFGWPMNTHYMILFIKRGGGTVKIFLQRNSDRDQTIHKQKNPTILHEKK